MRAVGVPDLARLGLDGLPGIRIRRVRRDYCLDRSSFDGDDAERAAAALISDLKRRGMLEETLVVFGGEFGRTPYMQKQDKGKPGRDHHHTAFSMMLAGGGLKGGVAYGQSDEFGMHAVVDPVHVHDLHATILYLLGIDHEQLTYRYAGRDFRLTDVFGKVVHDVIA